ncbi:MAG: hypothetical protein ACI9UJ_001187, partial [bacterium]
MASAGKPACPLAIKPNVLKTAINNKDTCFILNLLLNYNNATYVAREANLTKLER